uniref:CIROZ beta domain-containing protein n=1 Tax=Scleropages formosus TaxID=113540 RepID=A0A8C9RS14_SCLFO
MEASCPTGSDSPVDETVLYIYKRRMGLVKRGGGDGEVLSLSAISVKQTDSFSVFESSDLVRIALNTSLILRTRRCMGPAGKQLIQPFFRVDAVLTFKETPHHLVWSLENLLPCTESSALSTAATETLVSSASSGSPTTPSAGRTAAAHSANPAFRWPASTVARLLPKAVDQGASSATQSGTSSRVSMLSKDTQGDLTGVTLATVGDISVIPSADTQGTQVLETSTEGFLLTASKNESNLHPFRRPPLIFGHSLLTTSSLGVELREQLSHTPISASEILSVGSEVKDSAAEPSTEMVIGVETSSTPPHVSEEGAGWLSRNTSMEGQAKHVTLFPESPGMITSGSSSLLGTASPRSEMDHSPKEDLLQKANSLLANLRPQLSISSAAWLLLKAVTQGANLTNVSGSMTPLNTRGNLAGVTFEILRGVSASSPTDTHGTQTLLTGGVALTIPKHVFDSLLSGRSPPIFDQPQITTSDPQAELRERPAYTTGSLSSDQMLRRVPTNNLLPSDYESASSLLLRKTLFPGQTEHDILSPEQQSTIVSDSRSHPSTPSVLNHSTLAGFLLKTYPILTKPTPPTSIKIDPDLKTLPLTPATLSEFHTTSKPSSRLSSGYRLLPTHTDTWQLTSTPVLLLSRLRAKGTSSSNPFATSPSLNGGTLGVQEHLGSLEAVIRSMSPYPDTHKILSPALSSRVEPHVVSNTILNYVAATSVTLGQRTEVMDTHQVESSWEPVMNKSEEGESAPSGIPPETERTEPNVMLPQPQSTLDSSLLTNSSSVVDHSVEKDVLQKSSPANLTYMAPNGMETKAFTQRPSQPSQLLLQP